jgi:protein-tyrosine phosphatase
MTYWRTHVYGAASRWYGPRPANAGLSWIGAERIAVGSVPTAESVPRLAEQGITDVVNCRSRAQVLLSQDLAVERATFGRDHVVHAPMLDFGQRQDPRLWAPAARFAVGVLGSEPRARVLIHCQQGRRRSAMLAYAVLRLRGYDSEEAAELILSHRAVAELVPAYVRSVDQWLNA